MINRVITGGQTGADQAGWRAAAALNIPTGGWMPRGFMTEAGPRPEFAGLYGAREFESDQYPPRTAANVRESDAVLWFGNPYSPGGKLTLRLAHGKPHYVVIDPAKSRPEDVAAWLADRLVVRPGALMVAGNRESKTPGIGADVEWFLGFVLKQVLAGVEL